MKKILLIIFVFALVLSGGKIEAPNHEESNTPFSNSSASPNISVDVEIPDDGEAVDKLEIIYPAYKARKYNNLLDWQSYIKDKFGIEIIVRYKAFSIRDLADDGNDLNGIIYLNFEKGLVYEFNTDVLRYGSEVAYELSPFYKKYDWYGLIDDEYINALSENGGIYAVPTASYKYIIPRYYNETYLNELNFDVPRTIDEFYYYLKQTRNLHPDSETFFPMCISAHNLAPSTADIFRAYNTYLNTEFNSSISFNPNTGTFEDAVFSEDFAPALEFIRQLQNEKLLIINGFRKEQLSNGEHANIFVEDITSIDKNFASEYNYIYSSKNNFFIPHSLTEPGYNYKEGFFLDGLNTENTCEVRNDMAFYVFPKTITNINGVVERFNEVFTDTQYYADLKYGIINEDYINENDTIIIKKPSSGDFIDLKQIVHVSDNNACYVPSSRSVIDGLNSIKMYEQNVFNHIFTIAAPEEKETLGIGDLSIQILFNSNISAIESIEEYKALFLKSGKLGTLEQINNKLGIASQYDYRD